MVDVALVLEHFMLNSVPIEQSPRHARNVSRLDGVRTSREKAMKAVRFDQYVTKVGPGAGSVKVGDEVIGSPQAGEPR